MFAGFGCQLFNAETKKLLPMLYRKLHQTLAEPAVLLPSNGTHAFHEPRCLRAEFFLTRVKNEQISHNTARILSLNSGRGSSFRAAK